MKFLTIAALACATHVCVREAEAALPPFMHAARKLLRQDSQDGKFNKTQPEYYSCPGKNDGLCFFPHDGIDFTCHECCDTGLVKNAAGEQVSCWNGQPEFSPQVCCDERAPVNLPETPSPEGSTKCERNRDQTCWGNGFRCEECCTRQWVYVASDTGDGVEQKSCWTQEGGYLDTTLGGIGASGEFVPRNTADGGVTSRGHDDAFKYTGTAVTGTQSVGQRTARDFVDPTSNADVEGRLSELADGFRPGGKPAINKPMTFERCCQPPPVSRPPAFLPSPSPTPRPTPVPSTPVPSPAPTTPVPVPIPIPPTEEPTRAPTRYSCDKVFCPESFKQYNQSFQPYNEALNVECTDYHDGSGSLTDGFWKQPLIGGIKWTKWTYPPNIFCTYTVYGNTGPDGDPNKPMPVTLSFRNGGAIDMEANYDFVKVYDGGVKSVVNFGSALKVDGEVLRHYSEDGASVPLERSEEGRKPLRFLSCDIIDQTRECYTHPETGQTTILDLVAPSGILYITFQSDGSLEKKGFNASFRSWKDPITRPLTAPAGLNPFLPKLEETLSPDIDQFPLTGVGDTPAPTDPHQTQCSGPQIVDTDKDPLTGQPRNSGFIGTVNYPDDGTGDGGCSWVLAGKDLTLVFKEIDTENGVDFIKVYDGKDRKTMVEAYSGPYSTMEINALAPIKAATGRLEVVLFSDWSITGTGFKAEWTVTAKPLPKGDGMLAGAKVADTPHTNDSESSHMDGLIPIAGSLAGIVLIAVAVVVGYRIKKNNGLVKKQWREATAVQEMSKTPQGSSHMPAGKRLSKASAMGDSPSQEFSPDSTIELVSSSTTGTVPGAPTRAWET